MELPKGHSTIIPYLMLDGAHSFIKFMKSVFGGEIREDVLKYREDNKTIMHAEIIVGDSTIMFCETTEQWRPQPANLFIYVNSADETYSNAIKSGASSIMELRNQDYGRTCGVKDPFGNVWWITSLRSIDGK